MSYQEILRTQLQRRIDMNPRYSLRAFSLFLEIQASKLSEILNGKKGLGLDKAQIICQKLKLSSQDRDIFLLSVESQHSRFPARKEEALRLLDIHLQRVRQVGLKTKNRWAWYYGAVEACLNQGFQASSDIAAQLDISVSQVENAMRFLNRRAKNWPEKTQIRIEEASLLQKVQAAYVQGEDRLETEAFFLYLTPEDKRELQFEIQKLMGEFKKRKTKSTAVPSGHLINLNWVQF